MSTIKISELTSSGAILGNVLVPVVGNIAGTLTTIKSTVDQLKTFIVASAEANILAANSATIFANTIMKSYVDLANTIQSAQLTSANIGIIGYVNLANTIQSAQIASANLGIVGYVDNAVSTANIGIKGYVDSVASQSIYGNANVTAYTVTMGFTNFSNVNVVSYITTNGLSNYSNVNTKAYAESMGYQNFGNVNVAAYITTNGLTNYSNINLLAALSGAITIGGNLTVSNVYVPTANNSVGSTGQLTYDSNYVYVCIAANTWRRANLAIW